MILNGIYPSHVHGLAAPKVVDVVDDIAALTQKVEDALKTVRVEYGIDHKNTVRMAKILADLQNLHSYLETQKIARSLSSGRATRP